MPDPVPDLVLLRIRLYARRRIAWLRKIWEEGNPGSSLAVTHAAADACLDDLDSPVAEKAWYESDRQARELGREIENTEAQLSSANHSRFSLLHQVFCLGREESDLFQLCLALKLDPALSRLYAYLQDHAGRCYVTEELAVRLFGYGHGSIWRPDSPMARWRLIREKENGPNNPVMLTCDRFILQWLLGQDPVDEFLVPFASFNPSGEPLQNWPVDSTAALLERLVKQAKGNVRLIISGPKGSGRRTLAAILSERFNMPLMTVRIDRTDDLQELLLHAQRQAILGHYGIAWHGEKVRAMAWPGQIHGAPLQFVICEQGQKPEAAEGITDICLEMPELHFSEQQELFRRFVPVSLTWNKNKMDVFLSQHRLTIGEVVALGERAVESPEEAMEFISLSHRDNLGTLAQLLECPFVMDDLVITELLRNTLEDFIYEARTRKKFWENKNARKLFPQGRGLIGLFSGLPGTGKTMAAQVIAAELGLDLFRIDLSSVVSKYVGETSQNLERILSRAEHMDVVLLFDEADALFGKRTEVKDAHDRFANTDTNYLLQAIENYRGIAILASNKKENIDHAFIRRLRYVLEFPKPDAQQRENIWNKVIGKLLTGDQSLVLNGHVRNLAQSVELTGAQIKFALLSAVFAAGRDRRNPDLSHLIRGIERELMKEGRTLTGREREKLMANA